VYITPVPGISTTINDVMKNSMLIIDTSPLPSHAPVLNAWSGEQILNLEFNHHPAFFPKWNVLRKRRYKQSTGNGKRLLCHTYFVFMISAPI
jgi:hypothetical protein